MKLAIIMAISHYASSVFARKQCPAETQLRHLCTSSPQDNDSTVAAKMFNRILVCADDNKAIQLILKHQMERQIVLSLKELCDQVELLIYQKQIMLLSH